MKRLKLTVFLLLFFTQYAFTQTAVQNVKIEFRATFAGETIALNKALASISKIGSVEFSALKFYFGHFSFSKKGNKTSTNEYYLIDVSNPESMILDLKFDKPIEFETIIFNLGIDSLTNNSGALAGDLDPTLGMYWAWQSGYINMKIEGTCDSIPTKSNQFQYHLGGFLAPFESMQVVKLNRTTQKSIIIEIDLEHLLKIAFQEKYYSTMSPGIVSNFLSKNAVDAFKIKDEK
jgi:hypothetical protein